MKNNKKKRPVLLIILDGWGLSNKINGNAITLAATPYFDSFLENYAYSTLNASGQYVGLPKGQAGNSEAGHMNISAGFVVEQDASIINRSIDQGTFFKNQVFIEASKHVIKYKSDLHLIGLLSENSSPHASKEHIKALVNLFLRQTKQKIYLHFFTDGRDSSVFSALKVLPSILNNFDKKRVKLASIIGRFYAMDRKNSWSRTKLAYEALVLGKSITARNGLEAINQAYNRGESDEFILPTVITHQGKPLGTINDNDAVVFFNLRSDRARQLTKALVQKNFNKRNPNSFKRIRKIKNLFFVALTDFGRDLDNVLTAFPSIDIPHTLVDVLSDRRQLYIAEREKYAHVTYFFNGGYDRATRGEKRLFLPSPDVVSYNLAPAMSLPLLTTKVINFIKNDQYDFITLNVANPDMVGHSGDLEASIKAVEEVDKCLGALVKVINKKKGFTIITADHGNIEEMIDHETGEVRTMHSTNLVPFIIVDKYQKYKLKKKGKLANIAPTILEILKINKPKSMKAKSLIIK